MGASIGRSLNSPRWATRQVYGSATGKGNVTERSHGASLTWEDANHVAGEVARGPGRTRRAVAQALGGRLMSTLAAVDVAIAAQLVHVTPGPVSWVSGPQKGRARLAVVLLPGPAPAETSTPASLDGSQLRALRTAAGVTQGALAAWLGVSRPLVAQWESGRSVPAEMAAQVSGALEAETQAAAAGVSLGGAPALVGQILAEVRADPGISRAQVERRSPRRAEAVAYAEQAGAIQTRERPHRHGTTQSLWLSQGTVPPPEVAPVLVAEMIEARRAAAWSRSDLARAAGLGSTLLDQWENGAQATPEVPRWATEQVRAALRRAAVEAQAVDGDAARVRAAVQGAPGRRRAEVLRSCGLSSAAEGRGARLVELLAERGELHALGDELTLWPGPGPDEQTSLLRRERATVPTRVGAVAVAPISWSRWERQERWVPRWAELAAAAELAAMRTEPTPAGQDVKARLRAVVAQEPGLSMKQVLARAHYSVHASRARAALDELIAEGEVRVEHAGATGKRGVLFLAEAAGEPITAEQLRQERRAVGLPQSALAERVGVTKHTASHWESSGHGVPVEYRAAVRAALAAEAEAPRGRPTRRPRPLATCRAEVLAALPATLHGLDGLGLASQSQLRSLLAALAAEGMAHEGRLGAGRIGGRGRPTKGRAGWLPGPAPDDCEDLRSVLATEPPL